MRRLLCPTVVAAVVMMGAGAAQATSVFVGSVADWIANPAQVSADKTFTYIASSGGWTADELVTISSNIPQNSETLSLDGLSDYIGPQNLMLAYEVAISSTDVFGTISLDQDFSGATAITYKDIFASLADLQANPLPGSGTWALSVIDGAAGSTVAMPPLQTIWVRDTITLSASGSVLSVSNTIVQVPEPNGMTATAGLAGSGVLLAWMASRRRIRAFARQVRQMGPLGLEPRTNGLKVRCSNQLSYGPGQIVPQESGAATAGGPGRGGS